MRLSRPFKAKYDSGRCDGCAKLISTGDTLVIIQSNPYAGKRICTTCIENLRAGRPVLL